jgi:hypothetical protein
MFGIAELEGFDGMLARIFKEELQLIVVRYESRRMTALRELERRMVLAHDTSKTMSQYLFLKPQQQLLGSSASDVARYARESGQRDHQQSAVFVGPRT